ncbi:MAG: hypothetical protein ABII09_02875 [Planctomycetota bacterium]
MKIEFKATSSCIITLLFSLIISHRVIVAEDQQWQPVPEVNYADVLELIAYRAKANYDEISSWQGQMNIFENIHFYGTDAAEKSHGVDTNSIARNSQHICRTDKAIAEFSVDMHNDKLYSSVEPTTQYNAVDLDQNIPPDQYKGRPARTRTILTPESYMWYLTDGKFHSKSPKGPSGKMVFIESSQNKNVKGFVRDPRNFFDSAEGDVKFWDTILRIKSDISDRIGERVEGYPHIEISSMETESGIKYRILTTWKGGESYVIKYIRSLIEVDEAVGFNATKVEVTNPDGVKLATKQYTYEKIGEIYIPKTVRKESRNNNGELTFTSETTIETASINKPLPEDMFTIKNLGVEEDTLVTDNIKKAEFRYSKGVLIPISEPNNSPD